MSVILQYSRTASCRLSYQANGAELAVVRQRNELLKNKTRTFSGKAEMRGVRKVCCPGHDHKNTKRVGRREVVHLPLIIFNYL